MARSSVGQPTSEKLHPFFIKDAGSEAPSTSTESCTVDRSATEGSAQEPDSDRRRKRRKTGPSPAQAGADAVMTRKRRRKRKSAPSQDDAGIVGHLRAELSPPSTASNPATSRGGSAEPLAKAGHTIDEGAKQTEPFASGSQTSDATALKTRKILQFNPKTGTLGSPPKPPRCRVPSMIVCMKYGQNEQEREIIGARVTQILNGDLSALKSLIKSRSQAPSTDAPEAKDGSQNPLHPFFSDKSKKKKGSERVEPVAPTIKKEPKHSVFMSTPVSPHRSRVLFAPDDHKRRIHSGTFSLGTKIPGVMLPLWPAAGMSHVRNLDGCSLGASDSFSRDELDKKSKGQITAVAPPESLLAHLLGRLELHSVRDCLHTDEDSFLPVPAELRLPKKRFESGRRLQSRVKSRLAASSASLAAADDSSQDELAGKPLHRAHPAISHHYKSLRSSLSAFDRSSCESASWTQKYAPTTAAQVMQPDKRMSLLKEWLEALKVQSVDPGGDSAVDKKGKSEAGPKRKKRKSKLEGFVVDSDEEADELDELVELEDESDGDEGGTDAGPARKSVIRVGGVSCKGSGAPGRLSNTVIISGPHGCGKTAAVYAVAKELGFEVFELNPGSRRSGKDILEKVGDMTRNHLVQQHQHRADTTAGEGEAIEIEEKPASAKQGTMTSFFKPKQKQTAGAKQPASKKKAAERTDKGTKTAAAKASTSQKQSLILLEEADVLYEEDKQFWAALMTMMTQSKRPFVVTCNDENLIPITGLSPYAIFRFSAPRTPLAVDLCLLIAANEGHALGRRAVESLYRSRGNDLRATITELNWWCQMGVGDRKGGLDWFYPRWPKGCDVDDKGDVVRVISEGTYLHGMGWLGRDPIAASREPLAMEEESQPQAWNLWQTDLSHGQGASGGTNSLVSFLSSGGIAALAPYQDFCRSLSDADMCSRGAFGSILEEHVDPTMPELTANTRDDFIIGHTLLQADTEAREAGAAEAITLKSVARLRLLEIAADWDKAPREKEPTAFDVTRTVSALDKIFRRRRRRQMTRHDISLAFDPIAASAKSPPSSHLDPSVFDRPLTPIVLDVAPWVRGIMAFEDRLMQERLKLNSLLSVGGGGGGGDGDGSSSSSTRKRMRTTRSAYSALEAGERKTTRRERYFGDRLTTNAVMSTGASSFQEAAAGQEARLDRVAQRTGPHPRHSSFTGSESP